MFGRIVALNGLSFDMRRGQIPSLIGPNSAGRATLPNGAKDLVRIINCRKEGSALGASRVAGDRQ
jgi:ABC-type branched-subunit amino acid transport system ATPase component